MTKVSLFTPLQIGAIQLPNRIMMAPLTRIAGGVNSVPTAMNAEYYAQRASAGLIISEGTAVSPDAHGYHSDPGIYTGEQIADWRAVTDAVQCAEEGSSCKSRTTDETRILRCVRIDLCPLHGQRLSRIFMP